MASEFVSSSEIRNDELLYNEVTVSSVKCFELLNVNDCNDRAKRKKEKEQLGTSHLETPLLDTKYTQDGKKSYCDIIVHTDRVKLWDKHVAMAYSASDGYQVDSRDLAGSQQRNILLNGTLYVSLTFYPSTNKFMVQPGNCDEYNLIRWLEDFVILKSKVEEDDVSSSPELRLKDNTCNQPTSPGSESKQGLDSPEKDKPSGDAGVPQPRRSLRHTGKNGSPAKKVKRVRHQSRPKEKEAGQQINLPLIIVPQAAPGGPLALV